jgi:hypothetical protein
MQIGSFSNWLSKPGSDYFDYVEKKGDTITAEATGWHNPKRHYAFVYVPVVTGEVSVAPDKGSIDARFG